MIDKAKVKKWVDALRSGEYKQCKRRLNDGTGMCCLGVLADIRLKEQGKQWKNVAVKGLCTPDNEESHYLTKTEEWLGLDMGSFYNLYIPRSVLNSKLTEKELYKLDKSGGCYPQNLNDLLGLDFSRIADIIEETYLKEDNNAKG